MQSVGAYANYFEILGVPPLIGHTFTSQDQRKGWYIFWNRKADLEELKKSEQSSVPMKGYEYL